MYSTHTHTHTNISQITHKAHKNTKVKEGTRISIQSYIIQLPASTQTHKITRSNKTDMPGMLVVLQMEFVFWK